MTRDMRFFPRPFSRLQWQLSFSYTLVAVAALVVVELVLVSLVVYLINSDMLIHTMVRGFQAQFNAQLRPYLDRPEPDLEGLDKYLSAYSRSTPTDSNDTPRTQIWTSEDATQNLFVLDTQRRLLWSQLPIENLARGEPLDPQLVPGLAHVLPAAMDNSQDPEALYTRTGNRLIMAIPVASEDNQRVVGITVFLLDMPSITNPSFLLQLLPTVVVSLLVFTLAAGLVGSVFGFFTARRLTRRLGSISQAADFWSRGDFSAFITDPAHDELGELSRRLNTMAEHLQNLMDTRQTLATLEERNRIARELHDSVKQQVFATSMQLGAARALLPDENEPVGQRLAEAERLTRQAQSELTTLIHELRPVALEGKGLGRALRELAADWQRQTGIPVQFDCPGELALPLLVEQALFRVVQEALANIARHSGARQVRICMDRKDGQAWLSVEDDGRGFDPSIRPAQGMGLRSMRERVERMGGQLEIDSRPGEGTRLVVIYKPEEQ